MRVSESEWPRVMPGIVIVDDDEAHEDDAASTSVDRSAPVTRLI
jgi:hypothetical protein